MIKIQQIKQLVKFDCVPLSAPVFFYLFDLSQACENSLHIAYTSLMHSTSSRVNLTSHLMEAKLISDIIEF